MVGSSDIAWFKREFGAAVSSAVSGTPFSVDLITAIACQETGYLWAPLRRKVASTDDVLALCVGDTIGAPRRRAFPVDKAQLLSHPAGADMFAIARDALEAIAAHPFSGYAAAAGDPTKFCRGYGIFQYDLQFFKGDPEFFLQRRWTRFEDCLDKVMSELPKAQARAKLGAKTELSDDELIAVAIAYNSGSYDARKGLKQGHVDGAGKYYGELIAQFLALSRATSAASSSAARIMSVIARHGVNLREGPGTEFPVAQLLPYGTRVHVLARSGTWSLVDREGDGRADGHVHTSYLAPVD